jgi:NAD(P)H-hydrate epimerase
LKIVNVEQMREIERLAADEGFPSEVLMENAGLAVAREIEREMGNVRGRKILILIGPGNNGGDGLVTARHLHNWGAEVHLYICGREKRPDPNFELIQQRDIALTRAAEDADLAFLDNLLSSTEVVVDALFGIGKVRPLEGIFKQVLTRIKEAKEKYPNLTIIALDIPSGLNPDGGSIDPACLPADITVTLGYPKLGLFNFPGMEKVGKLIISDIGIPPTIVPDTHVELITSRWVSSVLPRRPSGANKGTFGKVLVVGGSINYIGALYLACTGAIRVGAGLVTLATARSLQSILASKLTEVTYIPLPESEPGVISTEASRFISEQFRNYDVLLLGCGLGQNLTTVGFVKSILPLLSANEVNLILDADALNILAGIPEWWQELTGNAILTPHPGEMSRLTGSPIPEIQSQRLEIARKMSICWHKTVVLKGAHTVVASPSGGEMVSGAANPALASAGTGDVLAGVIAGLLAQGLSLFGAAACGVYLHTTAGEMVRGKLGDSGAIASDLLPALPLAIKGLKSAGK